MSIHYSLPSARLARVFAVLALTLGTIGLSPLPALASPPAGPKNAPALGLLPSPVPTIVIATTSIANDPGDGQCDLWEALQAIFQANFDLVPSYHECTAALNAPNVIGFSGAAATSRSRLP